MKTDKKSICIVVLGDIGRSPRMQYHAISLAEQGHKVDIVGYRGTPPTEALVTKPLVSFHYLNPYPSIPCPTFLSYVLKTIWQFFALVTVFALIRKPDFILTQNPPAIPTFIACYIYKLLSKAKLIIDWHNYAYTIMALNVGQQHILVRITKQIENIFGRKADCNFCVTNEMKNDLCTQWNIKAITLYDRAPDIFHPITLSEKHKFCKSLSCTYPEFLGKNEQETIFTKCNEVGNIEYIEVRPALLVSSTSWTEDEDFSILLIALQDYEQHCQNGNHKKLPKLICAITGKGPLKKYYRQKIADENWKFVKIITPWLEPNDYPRLLAAADLGVCLHTSSSGLDLPMKVVDMFGCGLPVCAIQFKSLPELVQNRVNGFTFNDSMELSNLIQNWFSIFPNNKEVNDTKAKFQENLQCFQKLRWRENWNKIAKPIFDS